jgi:hypothetical protein
MDSGNFLGNGSGRQRAIIPQRSVLIMTWHSWRSGPTFDSLQID